MRSAGGPRASGATTCAAAGLLSLRCEVLHGPPARASGEGRPGGRQALLGAVPGRVGPGYSLPFLRCSQPQRYRATAEDAGGHARRRYEAARCTRRDTRRRRDARTWGGAKP